MKAKILSGDLKGVEFELSKQTIEAIKSKGIPEYVCVGQIYKINDSKYMIAAIEDSEENKGLTVVEGGWSGCFTSDILSGGLNYFKLRKLLINKNAKFLGGFNEVFKEIK